MDTLIVSALRMPLILTDDRGKLLLRIEPDIVLTVTVPYEPAANVAVETGHVPILWGQVTAVRATTTVPVPEAGAILIVEPEVWADILAAQAVSWEGPHGTVDVQYPRETWRIVCPIYDADGRCYALRSDR